MAKPKILDPIRKRDLLFGRKRLSGGGLLANARLYLDAGRLSDALDFADPVEASAERREAIDRIVEAAVESGDALILRRASRIEAEAVSRDILLRAARSAEGLGKWHMALALYQRAEDPDGERRASDRVEAFRGEGTAPSTPIGKGA